VLSPPTTVNNEQSYSSYLEGLLLLLFDTNVTSTAPCGVSVTIWGLTPQRWCVPIYLHIDVRQIMCHMWMLWLSNGLTFLPGVLMSVTVVYCGFPDMKRNSFRYPWARKRRMLVVSDGCRLMVMSQQRL
jgi:hypothetical protein